MVHAWKIRPLFVYCCTLSLLACSENPARPVVKDAVGPATDSLVPGDIALLDSATVDLPTQEADQAAGKLDLSPTQPDMDPPNPGGPLAGLPSAPGGHITQLEALGDNEWLELQQPGADPKWGRARGRAWGGRAFALAPELRGAFFTGEGRHAFVKPDAFGMDDVWFYDINQNRWICIHPGIDTNNFTQQVKDGALRIGDQGVLVNSDDDPVPVHILIHAWDFIAYDTDSRRFAMLAGNGLGSYYMPGLDKVKEGLALLAKQQEAITPQALSPWYFDTQKGVFVRELAQNKRTDVGGYSAFVYLPYLKQFFNGGSKGVQFYDPSSNRWSRVKDSGPRPPGYDHGVAFDSKRKRIYMGSGTADATGALYVYDLGTQSWTKPSAVGGVPTGFRTNDASAMYDDVSDVLTIFHYGSAKVYTYQPDSNTWSSVAIPQHVVKAVGYPQHHAFFDTKTNLYFLFVASDSGDNGKMFAYRYKKRGI